MAEIKANVTLSYDVSRKIEWLTRNYDNEIGAVGTVKIRQFEGEKYFYVDKLYFPKQETTGATVHITPDMWLDILRTVPKDKWGELLFYWHSHPGNAAHSTTDEEDTFETFMSKEAKRRYFIFLQTAIKTYNNGEMDTEARIDIRTPIRATIKNTDIELEMEQFPDEEKYENVCKKIIEDSVVEPPKIEVTTVNKTLTSPAPQSYRTGYGKTYHNSAKDAYFTDTKRSLEALFGDINDIDHLDNDYINGYATKSEQKVSIDVTSGCFVVATNKAFEKIMEQSIDEKTGALRKLIGKSTKLHEKDEKIMTKYKISPSKGNFKKLKEKLLNIFIAYNNLLAGHKNTTLETCEEEEEGEVCSFIKDEEGDAWIIENVSEIKYYINALGFFTKTEKTGEDKADVFDSYTGAKIGELEMKDNALWIYGDYLQDIVEVIQEEFYSGENENGLELKQTK